MGGFSDKVIGGVNKLIRSAIQSPNYVAAVSGWTINKDGSAEFADVSIRGTVTLDNASDAILVYDVNGDLAFAITQDSSTLPPHTSNPIVFGDHLGVGANAFGVLSFKTQHTSDWDMFIEEFSGYPVLFTKYIGNGSPSNLVFGDANLHGAVAQGIAIAPIYPDVVPGSPGPSTWQFGDGPAGAYYFEEARSPANFAIPNGATTQIVGTTGAGPLTIGSSQTDYPSGWNLSSGVWTPPAPGPYLVDFVNTYNPTGFVANNQDMVILKGGTVVARNGAPSATQRTVEFSSLIYMNAGETLNFRLTQNSGAGLTIAGGASSAIRIYRLF